ncbi:hypothetical protein GPALN_012574 [Globodera pallida]|nr:hypothetical protein GPALN_012574 [Globodera pallida]
MVRSAMTEARQRLSGAIGRVNGIVGSLDWRRLTTLRNLLAVLFHVPNNIALSQVEYMSQLTAETFTRQFAAMTARIDRDNIDTVRYTTDFLQVAYEHSLGYTGEPEAPMP